MATREQIMTALLAQLKAKCGATFQTYDRKFIPFADLAQMIVSSSAMGNDPRQLPRFPALFLYDGIGFGGGRDNWNPTGFGNPGIVTLYRTIVLYAYRAGGLTPSGPSSAAGAITMNPLIESVEAALQNDTSGIGAAMGKMTLGGLVDRVWIEGDGHCIPGDIDPSGLAMQTIPITIVVPDLG